MWSEPVSYPVPVRVVVLYALKPALKEDMAGRPILENSLEVDGLTAPLAQVLDDICLNRFFVLLPVDGLWRVREIICRILESNRRSYIQSLLANGTRYSNAISRALHPVAEMFCDDTSNGVLEKIVSESAKKSYAN